MYVSFNGSLIHEKNARFHAISDGLFYGAGCFETFTSYCGKFLHLSQHVDRLNRGVAYLSGTHDAYMTEDLLRSQIGELIEANNLEQSRARVRIQVSLANRRGYSIDKSQRPDLISLMSAEPSPSKHSKRDTWQLSTVSTTVVPSTCRPVHLKLSNMLHYRQAAIEAKQVGADDACMLTVNGKVAETAIANIFWESNGVIHTPSESCDILPGVTRSILVNQILPDLSSVDEGEFTLQDLKSASQVWICNSLKEIKWVSRIDEVILSKDTELQKTLTSLFASYKNEYIK